MEYTEHLFIGLAVGIFLVVLTNLTLGWFDIKPETIIVCLLIMVIYSLLPDIDHQNSKIVWWFIPASIVGMIAGYTLENKPWMFASFGLLVATFLAATIFKHRGFTHTIVFGLLISAPLIYFFSYQYAILSFLCFYSHMVADEEYFQFI
jgi:membrane-bound metal-dependent hydrolase YbcI (DUF457 family)